MLEQIAIPERYWINRPSPDIPGSTRVPTKEILEHFGRELLIGLDLGSGGGRSSEILRRDLGGIVVALDLNRFGLQESQSTDLKVQASAESLPFGDNFFNYASVCGLMTNIADRNPSTAQAQRERIAREIYRTVRDDGIVVVSDCASTNIFRTPKYNYERHGTFTGEYGTVIVFRPPGPQNFSGIENDQVQEILDTYPIERFAHHYSIGELTAIFTEAGFKDIHCEIEEGKSPKGNTMDAIVLTAIK